MLDLLIKPGTPVPGSGMVTALDAYSHQDGVTRRIPWSISPAGFASVPEAP
ncbi:hypothetical protein ACFQX6_33085 [Streptosporangium lutulentum]